MGQALLCDGCEINISAANRVSVSVLSLDGGSVQLDFCWECAKPMRQIGAIKEPMRKRREEIQGLVAEREAAVVTPEVKIKNDNADVDPDVVPVGGA